MRHTTSGLINASSDRLEDLIGFMIINLIIYWIFLATAMFALELLIPVTTAYWLDFGGLFHVRSSLPVILLLYMIGGFFKSNVNLN